MLEAKLSSEQPIPLSYGSIGCSDRTLHITWPVAVRVSMIVSGKVNVLFKGKVAASGSPDELGEWS